MFVRWNDFISNMEFHHMKFNFQQIQFPHKQFNFPQIEFE